MGWFYWYLWTILLPAELSAVAVLFSFWLPDISPAVWIAIALVTVTVLNSCSVRVYGGKFWVPQEINIARGADTAATHPGAPSVFFSLLLFLLHFSPLFWSQFFRASAKHQRASSGSPLLRSSSLSVSFSPRLLFRPVETPNTRSSASSSGVVKMVLSVNTWASRAPWAASSVSGPRLLVLPLATSVSVSPN